ncbi:MAG: metallopeptidase TldD-related protein [Pseudomonadota bacterium]
MDFDRSPEALLADTLDRCLAAGADAADARLGASEGVSVGVREGKLETIERDEGRSLALRAIIGRRQAHVSSADLSDGALSDLVDRVTAMAKAAPEDPYCGLADANELETNPPVLDLSGDPDASPEALEVQALEGEAAALAVDGVTQVSSAGAGWSRSQSWVAATNGFVAHRSSGYSSISVAAIAERDGAMERDYDYWSTRRAADRPDPAQIGRTAGERTVARLGSQKIASQTTNVIFDRRLSSSLLGAFSGAISGSAIARGVSFLKERLERSPNLKSHR